MQNYGVADYLVKPISTEALETAFKRLAIPVRRVLIIDDERDIVRLYSRMIQTICRTCEIWNAFSAQDGLELMRSKHPDVVILDLLMPDFNGLTLIECMKADTALADVPIVLVSGKGISDAIAPLAKGTLSLLKQDGFQPLELVRCLESLIDALTPASEPVR
jgi:YesN/AraC family two-component response regulator